MKISDTLENVRETAKNVFFPNGVNSKDELLSFFEYKINDPNLQELTEDIQDAEKNTIPFTIENYTRCSSWKKLVFIFTTQKLSSHKFIMQQKKSTVLSDSDSDFEIPLKKKQTIQSPSQALPVSRSRSLPGGSMLRLDQDISFFESLKEDQEKEKVVISDLFN